MLNASFSWQSLAVCNNEIAAQRKGNPKTPPAEATSTPQQLHRLKKMIKNVWFPFAKRLGDWQRLEVSGQFHINMLGISMPRVGSIYYMSKSLIYQNSCHRSSTLCGHTYDMCKVCAAEGANEVWPLGQGLANLHKDWTQPRESCPQHGTTCALPWR